jgi:hypothetical protein
VASPLEHAFMDSHYNVTRVYWHFGGTTTQPLAKVGTKTKSESPHLHPHKWSAKQLMALEKAAATPDPTDACWHQGGCEEP